VSSTLTPEREGMRDDDGSAESDRLITDSLQTAERRSERVKLRRGLTFLLMTLVLPGSAQVAAGNRRLGRAALRVWAALWVLAVLTGLFVLGWHSAAITVLTRPLTLRVLQGLLIVLGVGWALLFLDAWRISSPPEMARRHRLGFAALSIGLAFAVLVGLVASANVVSAQRELVNSVFSGGGDKVAKAGRINILLMGGDAGADRTGLRPDSMTVASVDEATGRTVLISLPRNLEKAPFPASSPLHKKFPKGFDCPHDVCMLNAVYTYAMGHKELYPHVKNPGAQATKEAIEGVTGLTINYWSLIDLKGFEDLVDALGGITMDVYRTVPIGGGPTHPTYGYVQAGKNRHLDGKEALWFARSRSDSSDWDRIVRQKCVMNAMLNQLDPVTVLTKFNGIASASKEIVATDVPSSQVSTMLDLAQKAKTKPVGSLAIVPPLLKRPADPDFPKIQAAIADQIAKSEAMDAPKPSATAVPGGNGSASTKPKSSSSGSSSSDPAKKGVDTSNLSKVCSA
jgi:polyisoprenyl-teichoic acid--peptidoglycan teichoic acid transferase